MSTKPLPEGHKPVRLSADALARLQVELAELKGPRRAELRDAVLAARQMGSIVENGDYTAAKEEERLVEDRISHVEDLLRRAVPVTEDGAGTVVPGAVVEVRFDGDDGTETYLFGEAAERSQWPVCTPESPLGRALAGARVGARLRYRIPSGATLTFDVVSVS
jgi:transcription elongation factor GreA